MLPGHNEDVKFEGKIYHVQTEDKGKKNPIIETLVYLKGTIVAARRRSYAKELAAGMPDLDLYRILDQQHKQIKALILKGQLDRVNAQPAPKQQKAQPKTPAPPRAPSFRDMIRSTPPPDAPPSALGSYSLGGATKSPSDPFRRPSPSALPPSPQVPPSSLPEASPPAFDLDAVPVYDTDLELDEVPYEPVRDEFLSSNFESFQRESPASAFDSRTDYSDHASWHGAWNGDSTTSVSGLTKPASFNVEVIGSPDLRSGQPASVRIMVVKKDLLPAKNAEVTLRVVGPAFEPLSLEQRTGPGGMVSFSFTVPEVVQGNAAVIVSANFENQIVEKKLPVAL